MKALTVIPESAGSAELIETIPSPHPGCLLARTVELGICGTDREILQGRYGTAEPGKTRLIWGHECLAQVAETVAGSALAPGDFIVPIVRRPDPVPCVNCAVGEWDMCRNGLYVEHGIKERDGYGCEAFYIDPSYVVAVPSSLRDIAVLTEPTSVVAKAWDQIDRLSHRAHGKPRTCVVTGAGPIGLLASLLGKLRDLEVHVYARENHGIKPQLIRDLGAHHHLTLSEALSIKPDVILECTGAAEVVAQLLDGTAPDGIVCLTGVSSGGRKLPLDLGLLNRDLVLENRLIFGSVNANRSHYEAAVKALSKADRSWTAKLITRRLPVARWKEAVTAAPDDIKTVIDWTLNEEGHNGSH